MPTIKDVAAHCALSICTVSKVLAGGDKRKPYSEATIKRVLASAKALDYRPNHNARSLRTRRSETLGVLMNLTNHLQVYGSTMIAGINSAVQEAGYHCLPMTGREHDAILRQAFRFLEERRVDGLLISGYFYERMQNRMKDLVKQKAPVVLFNLPSPAKLPTVVFDDDAGIRAAIEHLAEQGHRHIGWLGPDRNPFAIRRQLAAAACCQAVNLRFSECFFEEPPHQENWVALQENTGLAEGVAQLQQVLPKGKRGQPTAWVCYNDIVAMSAMLAWQQRGLHIPEDLSVIGFDDLYARLATPRLTSISHAFLELGQAATKLVIELLDTEKPTRKAMHRVVTPFLVHRQTVTPPR
jgi:LacI family transcriptional regulator